MSAAAEAIERCRRGPPFAFAERDDRDGQFLDERVEFARVRRAPPACQHHAGLDQRRRTDPHGVGLENAVDEIQETGLGEEYRDERGGIEGHTPPGP